MKQKTNISVGYIILFIGLLVGCFFGLPIIKDINTTMNTYNTQTSYRDNYKLHTTPMPQDIAKDICRVLEIENTSAHCKPNTTVYSPDFFDDLKSYFSNIPEEEKTYDTVQKTIGKYLQYCGQISSEEGDYRCRYDFIGDDKYSFFFYFDKNNRYYWIIANIGGS